jgi:hypothetical protein
MIRMFLIVMVLMFTATAQPVDIATRPIPRNFFGMHMGPWHHWPTVPFGALGKGNGATWEYIEETKGSFNWTNLDRLVSAAAINNVEAYAVIAGRVPCWAAPITEQGNCITLYTGKLAYTGMPADFSDWDRYVTALVSRYKSTGVQEGCTSDSPQCHGVITNFELWNEPENYFTGECANCSKTATSTIVALIRLTNRAYDIIRAVDPAATIVAPSFVGYKSAYMDQYYAMGGTKEIDVVSIHAYPSNLKEHNVPEALIDPNDNYQLSSRIRVWQKYGMQGKPIWDSEGSWSWESAGATTDPDLQSAYVARDYLLHWSSGIVRHYWYVWEDNTGGWGFFLNHGTQVLRPAANAYAQVYDWMMGATMPEPCTYTGTDVYNAVYTCRLTRPNGYQALAVWDTRGASSFDVPSQYTQYRDLTGDTTRIGDRSITITSAPILLESNSFSSTTTPCDIDEANSNCVTASTKGELKPELHSGRTETTVTAGSGFRRCGGRRRLRSACLFSGITLF